MDSIVGAGSTLKQKAGDWYDAYREWGEKNKASMPSWLNKVADTADDIANLPGADLIVPVGAMWKETLPKLMDASKKFRAYKGSNIHPLDILEMDRSLLPGSTSYNALERLTEVPAVRRAPLKVEESGTGFVSHPGYYTKDSWLKGKPPEFWEDDVITTPVRPNAIQNPVSAYAHEAAHSFLGPFTIWDINWWNKNSKFIEKGGAGNSLLSAAQEGFADGMSNALLGRSGKQSHATYWSTGKHRTEPLYQKAGEIGVEVGKAIRHNKDLDITALQSETVDKLLDMLKKRTAELGIE